MKAACTWLRIQYGVILIVLMVLSIVPVPITSTICLLLLIFRPNWFKSHIDKIYEDKEG